MNKNITENVNILVASLESLLCNSDLRNSGPIHNKLLIEIIEKKNYMLIYLGNNFNRCTVSFDSSPMSLKIPPHEKKFLPLFYIIYDIVMIMDGPNLKMHISVLF